jgi:hypothetical protein
MAPRLFYPFYRIQPSEIISQYSEWIYFTLVLVFFISIAGITLKKHLNTPYAKPFIISVGLMLIIGVFTYKHWLVQIFEGWGILGTDLLGIMAAIIPDAPCAVKSSRGLFMAAFDSAETLSMYASCLLDAGLSILITS